MAMILLVRQRDQHLFHGMCARMQHWISSNPTAIIKIVSIHNLLNKAET